MKVTRYIIGIIALFMVVYNSVYFKKLDQVSASKTAGQFNAAQYAQTFWNSRLLPNLDKAIDITHLSKLLSVDPEKTIDSFSHALGIGNLRYFLVKGNGNISFINENDIAVLLDSGRQTIKIATEYIFGNAVRDAPGLININEFTNTMDFNNVSAEINKIIRTQVLPPFRQQVRKGNAVDFAGAIEINKEHLDITHLEVIPIKIKIL